MSGPPTVETGEDCPECGRSLSERTASLTESGCIFCRGQGDD